METVCQSAKTQWQGLRLASVGIKRDVQDSSDSASAEYAMIALQYTEGTKVIGE